MDKATIESIEGKYNEAENLLFGQYYISSTQKKITAKFNERLKEALSKGWELIRYSENGKYTLYVPEKHRFYGQTPDPRVEFIIEQEGFKRGSVAIVPAYFWVGEL